MQVNLKKLIKECVAEVLKERLGNEVPPAQDIANDLYTKLGNLGFRMQGDGARTNMEYYISGFATVNCHVDVEENTVRVERYYDNEHLAERNISKTIPLPSAYSPDVVDKLVSICQKMKENIRRDEPIFGGMDELPEGFDPQSQGPNPIHDNPYPQWNAAMRQMEEGSHPLTLVYTGEDDWSRPVYKDTDGNIYVDTNLGQGEPLIHSVANDGEPSSPVINYTLSGTPSKNRHPNALCPRCKNSKPERMTNYEDGTKTCNVCHWSNHSDKFDKYREKFGAEKVDELLSKFGLGPNYTPKPQKKYICPQCHKPNAIHREAHADTDMNCMELQCPDCNHSEEL